jgi:hypothetical protein
MIFFFIEVLTFTFFSSIHLISTGLIFKKILFKNNKITLSELGLYGLIYLGIIALIINFFSPLNKVINSVIFLIPLLTFFFNKKKEIIKISIIISVISSVTIFLDNSYVPDAGLYHLPFARILNESKIIIGLSNINFTYGQSSFLQYISAVYNNLIFKETGLVIPLVYFYSFFLLYLLLEFFTQKNKLIKFILFLFLFYVLYGFNRYSEYGNDAPAHILFFYIILKTIIGEIKKQIHKNFQEIVFISLIIFMIKPTMGLVFLIPIYIFFKNKLYNFFKSKIFYLIIIISLFYITKNLLLTGCLIYPQKNTCVETLPWYSQNIENEGNATRVSNQGLAWTKGFPDQPFPQKNFEEYLRGFYWVKIWMPNHGLVILKKNWVFLLLIFILQLYFFNKNKILIKKNNILSRYKKNNILYLNIILFFSTLIWFLYFPVFRYGAGYIVSFIIILLISINTTKIVTLKKKIYKNINLIILLLIFIICLKNFYRIYKNYENNYNNYPWPKIYSDKNGKNNEIELEKVYKNGIFYFNKAETLCYYNSSPCTHFDVFKILNEVDVKEFKGYKIYQIIK